MSFCISPWCSQRENPDEEEICQSCGTPLLINDRIRLLHPMRELVTLIPSEVFEVEDLKGSYAIPPGRRVLKTLRTVDAKRVEMLEREIRALQMLNDPGIPKADLGDFFEFQPNNTGFKLYCLLMTKLDGQDLDKWIEENGRISQEKALDWLKQFFQLLHKVHDAGFFHRDIKPSNILLKDDGTLALIDFGGVREVTESFLTKISGTGEATGLEREHEITIVRTPLFSPPEQSNGRAIPQSDFYAAGRTFVCLVTGLDLFDIRLDGDNKKLLWREKAPHIDPPLADFIDKLMSLSPKKRPKTTGDILDQIDQLPRQIKRYQKLRSPWFRVGACLSLLVILFGAYKGAGFGISRYYFGEGTNKLYEGKRKEAKTDFKIAIQFDPNYTRAYHNLASACLETRDKDCAISNFNKALKLDPTRWTSYYQLGTYFEDEKQYKQSGEYYQKAIDVGGGDAGKAINNLARIRILQEDYQDAVRLATQGISLPSNSPHLQISLYKNRGWAKLAMKQYDSALKDLTRASDIQLTQEYQRADPFCLLAQVYEAKKETLRANIHWEMCLRMPSDTPEVQGWRYEVIDRLFQFE